MGFHGFLVLCAAINVYAYAKLIYRNSENTWLSFLMLCCLGMYRSMFFLLRQALAVSFVILGILKLQERKRMRAILFFVLAFTFHRTSILSAVFVPIFLFKMQSVKKSRYLTALVLWIPFLLLSGKIYQIAYQIMATAFKKGGYAGHALMLNNNVILIIAIVFLSAAFSKFSEVDTEMKTASCWATIFLLYYVTIGMYNDIVGRSIDYYYMFLLIWIPHVISHYHNFSIRKIS